MAAKNQVDKYFQALKRLELRGEPINNDTVAREAGSGKGSIKKSRPGYAELIVAIDEARLKQKRSKVEANPTPELKRQIALLQQRLDSALEREVCLLKELYDLREELRQLNQGCLSVVSDKKR